MFSKMRFRERSDQGTERHDLGLAASGPLTAQDDARVDRFALSRTLEALGYLTKTQVRRPAHKPKRKTKDSLERKLKAMRESGWRATAMKARNSKGRRWWRFTLRETALDVACIAIALGWYRDHRRLASRVKLYEELLNC